MMAKNEPSLLSSTAGFISFFMVGFSMYLPICGIVLGEMSFLIQILPEGKRLPAIAATAFSVSNICPLILYLVLHFKPKAITDWIVVGILQVIGLIDLCLLAAVWWWEVDGVSIGLILFSLIGGIVGTTCVLVVFNFAAPFRPGFTSAISAGLSGAAIFTSSLAVLQNSVNFSVTSYFVILASIAPVSIVCLLLIRTKWLSSRILRPSTNKAGSDSVSVNSDSYDYVDVGAKNDGEGYSLMDKCRLMSKPLASMFISSLLNFFVMPSIFPFISVNDAFLVTITAVYSVSNLVGRILCAIPWLHENIRQLFALVFLQFLCFVYMVTASIVQSWMINWVVVTIVMSIFSVLNGYIVTEAMIVAHEDCPPALSEWSVRATSLLLQAGNVLGGPMSLIIVSFVLVR